MQQDRRWELFECQRCGKCCIEIGLPCDPDKICKIAKFLNITVNQVIVKYYGLFAEDGKTWVSEDYKRTPCPFLKADKNKKICAIYTVRPWGCELYPFETDFGRQDVDCPGAKIVDEILEKEET